MSTTVLNLLKSCCYRWNIPFPATGTIFGNSDPGARQLLHVLYAVAEELRQAACWREQKKTYTFATVSGTNKYQLPQDFWKMSPFTEWNNTKTRRLIGPQSDGAFTAKLYGGIGSTSDFEYRLFGFDNNSSSAGGQFHIYPTPTDAQTLYFEYLTSSLFKPKNWAVSTAYTSGVYVNVNNNIYLCDTNGTSSSTSAGAPATQTQNITDNTTRWDFVAAPYETILADTDLMIFDEALIKLGVRAKWRDEKGEESEKAEAEYKSKIEAAVAKLQPSFVGSFSRTDRPVLTVRGDRDGGFLT